ncbi:hypothetical protein I545_6618 [Mycobacterium kansasii 662]|uniref:Uncharacterized protein n=1 Tax=Mycobacterium kansasii 662 TaxID=1299326 RepID=X7Y7W7_MYCKA|nr:hypothetical protein I545_6618 [Mycobacterium kansasii 662]
MANKEGGIAPSRIVRKLTLADRLLSEGKDTAAVWPRAGCVGGDVSTDGAISSVV